MALKQANGEPATADELRLGFDLVRNIRADERLQEIPIIMITSRLAEKHREHAARIGANHYLGKPYVEDELLGLIRSYTD